MLLHPCSVDEDAADWRLPFRLNPSLLQSMESARVGVLSATLQTQKVAMQLRCNTGVIIGGPPAKKFKNDYK